MLTRAVGKVVLINDRRGDTIELSIDIDGFKSKAVAYTSLCGSVEPGDEVLLNTTAVNKRLGTGGYHFVIANLSRPDAIPDSDEPGHIVKARYTPVQHTVMSVEEDDSPYRAAIDGFVSLNQMPVVIGQLHSQLAPAAAGIKRAMKRPVKVCYIMTDSAALPMGFSRSVNELREHGMIDSTITCGQAFGGDFETVNLYTALIAAKEVAEADAVVVCPGPGNVGTGTTYGFSSIEQGEVVNTVNILGGDPVAIARISFADSRKRHHGISHHTITALTKAALTKCTVVLPMIDQMKLAVVEEQVAHSALSYRHKTRVVEGKSGIIELQERGVRMSSMGRSYEDDPEFFLSAAAAGVFVAEILKSGTSRS